ncbi:MAG: acyl-CoA dehydrogenase family protein [Dehalococcoidales bacterium]|nr:acyl-CoA dehydrogenase family protein [Dehalococcoidales bacterium]
MDFDLTPQEEAFRQEISTWLDENLKDLPVWWGKTNITSPDMEQEDHQEFYRKWHKKLYEAGFVGITWPKEYGGRGGTVVDQYIFNEEMEKHHAPALLGGMGLGWAGPTIMAAGSEEQKKRFLPRILNGDDYWCQAFSEPEAGSDMANVKTRAVEEDDHFIVSGQKVWTTGGMRADWAILLAKTDFDPATPRHKSLSFFLLDMHAPGVTVRPLREMTGDALFGETFLDEVKIPKSLLVGEKNNGWYISMATLEFERLNSSSAFTRLSSIRNLIDLIKTMEGKGRSLSHDPAIRQRVAQLYIEANICKYLGLRTMTRQIKGMGFGTESAVTSLLLMELNQRIHDLAMDVLGPYGLFDIGSKYAVENGNWIRSFLSSRGDTIMTGTSEIKRNVIAQRSLGLPR